MVTGRQAFHGDSKLSTLSAILKEEPGPLPVDVPRDLEKIIVRCLRKDPGRRFQHAGDLKLALLELKEESDSGKLAAPGAVAGPSHRARLWGVLAAVLVGTAGLGTWIRFRAPTVSGPAPKMVPLTSYPGQQLTPALSPDGRQVAFSWDSEHGDNFDIYVKLVGGGTPVRLTTNPAPDVSPAWSPDGGRLAFLRIRDSVTEVLTIPALGGPERKLGQVTTGEPLYSFFANLSWSPDGRFLAVAGRTPQENASIYLISIESGEKRRLTSAPHEYEGDFQPRFSPDGKNLAYVRSRSWASDEIYVVPVAAGGSLGGPSRVSSGQDFILGLDWTPDGRNIMFSAPQAGGSALWIIPAAGGRPERLAGAGENGIGPSISRQGNRLAYERSVTDPNIWRIPGPNAHDLRAAPEKWIASTEADQEVQFSPDGKKIVFVSTRSGDYEIWTCESNGREVAQLTSLGGPPAGSPRWSPDGRWIAFDAPKVGKADIFVISADGGVPRLLTSGTANNIRPSWSRDGRWIYFSSNRSGNWQIWKAPAQGGLAVQITKSGGYEAFESPDGKLVYYSKLERPGIWRVAIEGGEETPVLGKVNTGTWALAKDGIYFFDWKDVLRPVMQSYSFSSGRSTTLYEFPRGTNLDNSSNTAISVSPDGRWILYTQIDQAGSNLVLVENFR
jgi:eukaryotic-like serine/threonine-protein kinase